MIRGQVRASQDDGAGLESRVPVDILSSFGAFRSVEMVVDTGFTGLMSLTESVVLDLGLERRENRSIILADGERQSKPTYLAELLWHGQPVTVLAYMMGDRPMIGTALLSPCHLSIDLWEGGAVIIEERTPPAP